MTKRTMPFVAIQSNTNWSKNMLKNVVWSMLVKQ